MSKKFRQGLKMIALRWFTKFQRGFAKNFLETQKMFFHIKFFTFFFEFRIATFKKKLSKKILLIFIKSFMEISWKWFLGFWHLPSLSMAAINVQKFHFRLKATAFRLWTKIQSGFKLKLVFIIFPKYWKTLCLSPVQTLIFFFFFWS